MYSVTSQRQVGNLPLELDSFIGRRRESRDARRLLGDSRLLTLVGVGGVGKTRLALRVAAEVRRTFPDGVWLVELAPLQDGDLVPETMIATLGLRDESARAPMDTLSEYLADKRLLLVLDNCEHLLDACATLAINLLVASEGLRILATSRQVLNVQGEQILEVPPLMTPDSDSLSGSSSDKSEAVRLFADRAAAVVTDFAVTAENRVAIERLCRRLDGIPLAIELATVRLRTLSVDQIIERLDDRYRLLVRGGRAAFRRHQTLKAAIDWSYDLCSVQEQRLWARLSVFSGGFELDAAEQTCSDESIPPEDVVDLVSGLVDKSILTREKQSPRMRFRLLETVRQYGRDRLVESGQEKLLQERHRDYYHHVALRAKADFISPRQTEWFGRLQPELPNLRVALNFCLTEPDQLQVGLETASALFPYWMFYGVLGEPRHWLIRALELDPEPTIIRAKALAVAAHLSLLQGSIEAALLLRDEAIALAQRLGDGRALAHATHISGLTAWGQGELDHAILLLMEALERSRTDGDDLYEMYCNLLFLAMATSLRGDDRSAACCAELLAAVQSLGADSMLAWATWALGLHHWSRGDNPRATGMFQDALRLHRTSPDLWSYAWCTEALAWTAADDGRYQRAARLLGVTQAFLRSVGGNGSFRFFAAAHEQSEAQVRQALGDDTYVTAVRHGSELDLHEAIAYALSEQTALISQATPSSETAGILTRRERQVAELISQGLSNKQIAATLVIAQRTAETHVGNILTKLGFTSRTQVAAWNSSASEAELAESSWAVRRRRTGSLSEPAGVRCGRRPVGLS